MSRYSTRLRVYLQGLLVRHKNGRRKRHVNKILGFAGGPLDAEALAEHPEQSNVAAARTTVEQEQATYKREQAQAQKQQPITQQGIGQMAGFGADFAEQFKSNPRLARLLQLANTRHCKGG